MKRTRRKPFQKKITNNELLGDDIYLYLLHINSFDYESYSLRHLVVSALYNGRIYGLTEAKEDLDIGKVRNMLKLTITI